MQSSSARWLAGNTLTLSRIDGVRLDRLDLLDGAIALIGVAIITCALRG